MGDQPADREPDSDERIEQEIRQGRKFTSAEALSRLAGPGAMKGASPVSRVQQAQTEIGNWLGTNVTDVGGALKAVVHRQVSGSKPLLENPDQPLAALRTYCETVLDTDFRLSELAREADVEWGRRMDERPYFERDGATPHPDDPYTVATVRKTLADVLERLSNAAELKPPSD